MILFALLKEFQNLSFMIRLGRVPRDVLQIQWASTVFFLGRQGKIVAALERGGTSGKAKAKAFQKIGAFYESGLPTMKRYLADRVLAQPW